MDSINIVKITIVLLCLAVSVWFAARNNLYGHHNARHLHRYQYGLLLQSMFYAYFLFRIGEQLLASAPVIIPAGCVCGYAMYLSTRWWFHRHFDGDMINVDFSSPTRYAMAFLGILVFSLAFQRMGSLSYPVLGTIMVAWTITSILFIVYLRKVERNVGHAIFERATAQPRTP